MELKFTRAPHLLRDACPPNPPTLLWQHPTLDLKLRASAINLICSTDSKQSLRHSVMLAGELALRKKAMSPVRGINPFTGINESEEYDKSCYEHAKNMNVLYINSLTSESEVEEALVQTLPGMDKWIWVDRDRGGEFPYRDLGIHILSIRSGSIMKKEASTELKDYVRQNKIDVIVVNSFEFACRTQREKDDMVDLLKFFRDEYCASILIYTHESEKRFRGGSRRGPMGALSILADWVSTIEAMAPELLIPGVCESEPDETYIGYEGKTNTYRAPEEVVVMLQDAPESMLPREHVRQDGTLTKERFDMIYNVGAATVTK
jgi:hypothetical protein